MGDQGEVVGYERDGWGRGRWLLLTVVVWLMVVAAGVLWAVGVLG